MSLRIDTWKTAFLLGPGLLLGGYVSFREGQTTPNFGIAPVSFHWSHCDLPGPTPAASTFAVGIGRGAFDADMRKWPPFTKPQYMYHAIMQIIHVQQTAADCLTFIRYPPGATGPGAAGLCRAPGGGDGGVTLSNSTTNHGEDCLVMPS